MSLCARTDKQLEIVQAIVDCIRKGLSPDIATLQASLSYKPSYYALQCSLKFLEKHELIVREYEVRKSRKRCVFKPTVEGYEFIS